MSCQGGPGVMGGCLGSGGSAQQRERDSNTAPVSAARPKTRAASPVDEQSDADGGDGLGAGEQLPQRVGSPRDPRLVVCIPCTEKHKIQCPSLLALHRTQAWWSAYPVQRNTRYSARPGGLVPCTEKHKIQCPSVLALHGTHAWWSAYPVQRNTRYSAPACQISMGPRPGGLRTLPDSMRLVSSPQFNKPNIFSLHNGNKSAIVHIDAARPSMLNNVRVGIL